MECGQLSFLSKNDSTGRKFEKLVLEVFNDLGFTIDEGLSGVKGELDVIIIEPIKIGIECRASKSVIGVNIIEELKRHIRDYKSKSDMDDFIGLIVGQDFNRNLIEQAIIGDLYLIKASSLEELCKFAQKYPFEPIDFNKFLNYPGEIDNLVTEYIRKNEYEYSLKGIRKESKIKEDKTPLEYNTSIPQELTSTELKKLKGKSPLFEKIYKKLRKGISEFGYLDFDPSPKEPIKFMINSIVFARVQIQQTQIRIDIKIKSSTFIDSGDIVYNSMRGLKGAKNSSFRKTVILNRYQEDLILNALNVIKQSYEVVKSDEYDR